MSLTFAFLRTTRLNLKKSPSSPFYRNLSYTKFKPHKQQNLRMNQQQTLDYYSGPLVWIDCEMTGLNPQKDKIIEIAVLITNGNLDLVDEGIQYVIRTDKESLDGMDEWCTNQHGQSGLTQACLNSPHDLSTVSSNVLSYIQKWIPHRQVGVLAGNSVHADRAFLVEHMPEVVDWLHYRIVDVSSFKEVTRRWFPRNQMPKTKETSHRALDDIRGSIQELKWYRENLFITPEHAAARVAPPTRYNTTSTNVNDQSS